VRGGGAVGKALQAHDRPLEDLSDVEVFFIVRGGRAVGETLQADDRPIEDLIRC
jgi:hypothetical protein